MSCKVPVVKHVSPFKNKASKVPPPPDLKVVNLNHPPVTADSRMPAKTRRTQEEKVKHRVKEKKRFNISPARILRSILVIIASVVTMILISGFLVAGYFYMSNSDYLMVYPENITVKGLQRLSHGEVLTAAGLDHSFNFLTLDVTAALRSLKSLPWVESAEISRSFPDGVSLEIVEYQAKALVSLDQLHYINENGRPFKMLDPGENPNLPIISGFAVDELLNNGPLVRDRLKEVFWLMELLAARHDEFRLEKIAEFNHDPDRGITIYIKGGQLEIKMGSGAFVEKLIRLGQVVAHLKLTDRFESVRYLDFDSPLKVIGRLDRKSETSVP
ncbi:MAG: FtsQ-type POTRA domain-containing protein [Deltaproteobacteria bacterium]|jgi:cell division protein FtsQ|nr:FtsQ-type POTRA domain-containing protein [Deltaproteobacteria bacterium]